MTFWKRFKFYLIGFGLGLLMVYGIFGNRNITAWTPQGRVLQAIDSSEVSFSERAICQLNCNSLSELDITEIMKDAEVDFSESQTRIDPCPIYTVSSNEEKYMMLWEVCEREEKVKLLAITSGKKCDC